MNEAGAKGNAATLLSAAMAYKKSDAIEALVRMGIAALLDGECKSPDRLAKELALDASALAVLLRFARSVGFLETTSKGYCLTAAARELLPLLELEARTRTWHTTNDSLTKVLRGDRPQDPMDSEEAEEFRGLYDRALGGLKRAVALELIRLPEIRSASVLLDLGGGDGSLASELLRLGGVEEAIVVDRAATEASFRQKVSSLSAQTIQRIRFIAADLRAPGSLKSVLGSVDIVLMSNVVHLLDTEARRELWCTFHDSCRDEAVIAVYDQFPGDGQGSDLMIMDWLRCGSLYDMSAESQMTEMEHYGLKPLYTRLGRVTSGSTIVSAPR